MAGRRRTEAHEAVIGVLLGAALAELFRTAWISDDAAITLRTVLNFTHGYGARFNLDERVQAYTHPLWFLLLSGLSFLARHVFWTTFALSIGVSLVVLWILLTRVATRASDAAIAGSVLLLSKAYVDFSTSGLENPLSHLLILLAVLAAIPAARGTQPRNLWIFLALCSATYLSRPDLPVLLTPLAIVVTLRAYRSPADTVRALAIGSAPALIWTTVSLYYYGFPFPNTAYAKLGTGIGQWELIAQGVRYLRDSWVNDPLTLAAITAGTALGLFTRSALGRPLAMGIVLYLAYIVSIGGDFMSGRFFTPPLVASAVILATTPRVRWQTWGLATLILLLGATHLDATLLSGRDYAYRGNVSGIADERGFYFKARSLRALLDPQSDFARDARRSVRWTPWPRGVTRGCQLGFASIFEKPGYYWMDGCSLVDPLLARLPARVESNWRIGHFHRIVPKGYGASVALNENRLVDPVTRDYYESIRIITRQPLNSVARVREIARMNLGLAQNPDWLQYRNGGAPSDPERGVATNPP